MMMVNKNMIVDISYLSPALGRFIRSMKDLVFPKMLAELMKEKKLTVRSLSKECGVPASTLQSYLSGKKAAYAPDHLLKISEFFSVTLDYLLYGKGSSQNDLNTLLTEKVFDGWLRVKISRAISVEDMKAGSISKRKKEIE